MAVRRRESPSRLEVFDMPGLFSSSKQQTSQTSQVQGTSTSSGARTKPQSNVFKAVLDQLLANISQGVNVTDADRAAMRASVGNTYNAIAPSINAQLSARGLKGATAKKGTKDIPATENNPLIKGIPPTPGTTYRGLSTAAQNEIQKQEAILREQAQNRFYQMGALAGPYTRPDTTTTTYSQKGSGTGTFPGPSIFDRILGYASDAAGLAAAFGWQPFASSPLIGGGDYFSSPSSPYYVPPGGPGGAGVPSYDPGSYVPPI